VPVAIRYEFLIAAAGAINNAQYEITGARISYSVAAVNFPCWAGRCTAATLAAATPLVLQTSVAFIDTTSGTLTEGVIPPSSVLPALPVDIFYPFFLGSSDAVAPAAVWSVVLACATALVSAVLL
jgi:hypothetical protein